MYLQLLVQSIYSEDISASESIFLLFSFFFFSLIFTLKNKYLANNIQVLH